MIGLAEQLETTLQLALAQSVPQSIEDVNSLAVGLISSLPTDRATSWPSESKLPYAERGRAARAATV